jgi:hypothetical protein
MRPASQKAQDRPIGFALQDASGSGAGGELTNIQTMNLIIRPEELTRNEPQRVTPHQTVNGTWADTFGQGIATIDLSGTTGWRGNRNQDGETLFRALHDDIFLRWNRLRAERAKDGSGDPDTIEMIFSDDLDKFCYVVAPKSFQLRREKRNPLLSKYHISLIVLGEAGNTPYTQYDPITDAIYSPQGRYSAAIVALQRNIEQQKGRLDGLDSGILGDAAGAARDLVDKSNTLLEAVLAAGAAAAGAFDAATAPILYAALALEKAGSNAFQIMATVFGVEQNALYTILQIGRGFQEAYCLLLNGFGLLSQITDVENLFGASYCSSTGGGRPLAPFATDNPFYAIAKSPDPPVSISDDAQAALARLHADPLEANGADNIGELFGAINSGVTLH